MYISKELEEAIKQEFNIKEFSYIGVGRNLFNENLLIFDVGVNYYIAIYPKSNNVYKICEVVKDSFYEGRFYRKNNFKACLYEKDGNTYLNGGRHFEIKGIAFDFTNEFVLAKLEEG